MSCGVGCRCGLDLVLLWLWCRQAATALIESLGWEPPCAVGAAPKRTKKKGKEEKEVKEGAEKAKKRRMSALSAKKVWMQ